MPTPPETDYENYDSEEEERKKAAKEAEEIKRKMTPKSSNATKAAFGAGKSILNRMKTEGWTIAPGGQLIKPAPVVKPRGAGAGKLLVKTQDSIVDLNSIKTNRYKPDPSEPPIKSPRIERKQERRVSPVPVEIPTEVSESEIEVPEEPKPFSLENEIKKMQKIKEDQEKIKNQKKQQILSGNLL